MRERVERIGARLRVRNRAIAGTEVELSIPGKVAFQGQPFKASLLKSAKAVCSFQTGNYMEERK